jgi:hypothetical protein
MDKRTMRQCPCCGQDWAMLTDAEYRRWLLDVTKRLRGEGKHELAEAVFALALEYEELTEEEQLEMLRSFTRNRRSATMKP